MRARCPVPVSSTAASIAPRMASASDCSMTRRTDMGEGASIVFPAASVMRSSVRGRKSTPPFAMTVAALAICNAVTSNSWPIATVGLVLADQSSGFRRRPGLSPARSAPALSPNPNSLTFE